MSLVGTSRRMGDLLVGSWVRTGVVALLALLIFAVAAWAGATGRLAGLRYADIPWIHPYPPAGYYINPLNPAGDRGDLVNASEASRVKAELLADGRIELAALEQGDQNVAAQADIGNALVKLQQLIAQNNAAGVFERQQTHLDAVVVGRLADPNAPNDTSFNWCVEEKGTGTITKFSKSTGEQLASDTVRVDAKFWLVLSSGRYLITDTQIVAQPLGGG